MIYQELTGEIIGCAMEVHRTLGSNFQEYVYQRALEIELAKKQIKYQREFEIKIYYKGEYIALRRVDFLIENVITVELKAKTTIEDVHLAQFINYLESSSYPIGLLINSGAGSLQFKRLHNKKSPHNQIQSNES
ncbi:MAG: GxxExxY protein [Chitinophagaceae bacterium]